MTILLHKSRSKHSVALNKCLNSLRSCFVFTSRWIYNFINCVLLLPPSGTNAKYIFWIGDRSNGSEGSMSAQIGEFCRSATMLAMSSMATRASRSWTRKVRPEFRKRLNVYIAEMESCQPANVWVWEMVSQGIFKIWAMNGVREVQ